MSNGINVPVYSSLAPSSYLLSTILMLILPLLLFTVVTYFFELYINGIILLIAFCYIFVWLNLTPVSAIIDGSFSGLCSVPLCEYHTFFFFLNQCTYLWVASWFLFSC